MYALPTLADLPELPDVTAPDGSEIRLLPSPNEESSMVHAALSPASVTQAVQHKTVKNHGCALAATANSGEPRRTNKA